MNKKTLLIQTKIPSENRRDLILWFKLYNIRLVFRNLQGWL